MSLELTLDLADCDAGGSLGVAGEAGELLDVDLLGYMVSGWLREAYSGVVMGTVPLARSRNIARLGQGPPSRGV